MMPAMWPALVLLAALAAPAAAARTADSACGAPAELVESNAPLPATAQALDKGRLRILVVGSASVLGPGTSGPAAAWPERLHVLLERRHPGVAVEVTVRGGRGLTAEETSALIAAELAQAPAQLVLWQTGTVEAVRGLDLDHLTETLDTGIEKAMASGADVVLLDPQFSRFLRANANVEPYRDAMRLVAAAHGIPMLRRYELMRFWAETDRVDLERAPREMRMVVADRLNLCIAEAMAALIRSGVAEARDRAAVQR